jgi:hypothetical protein
VTVQQQTIYNVSLGNGVTSQFFYQFRILAAADLLVYVGGVLKTLNVDYTVAGVGADNGGSITMLTGAPGVGVRVALTRKMRRERLTDYQQQGDFNTPVVNPDFDRAIMIAQEIDAQLGRTLLLPVDELDALATLPPKAIRSGKYIAFDANGQPAASAGTGNDSALRTDLANGLTGPGSDLVAIKRTAAEIAAAVVPVNYSYPPGNALRYGADPSGVLNSTTALANSVLQSYQATGAAPYWPAGTYLVSNITLTGPTHIRTDGYATKLKQIGGFLDLIVLYMQSATNVWIEPISIIGDMTDAGEFHHAVGIGSTCSHIRIDGVRGTNIRGDVLNIAGTAGAGSVFDVQVGPIDGTNVYRNVLSITGGQGIEIDSVQGTQVGYRLFDIEPNAGSQTPSDIRIKYVRGATINFAGASLAGGVGSVIIDFVDLDNNLLANSTPGYPSFPTAAGNIAIVHGDTQSLRIGYLKARNYQERLFNSSGLNHINCSVVIDAIDVANCNTTEAVFKTLFNIDAFVQLEVKNGPVVLAAIDRYIVKGAAGAPFKLVNLAVSGGCVAATGSRCEFDRLAVNANGVNGNLFAAINLSDFRNCTFTNDGAATLQNLCSDNVWRECAGAPLALNTAGGTHVFIKTTWNGNLYHANTLEAVVAFNPGNMAAGARVKTTVAVNGAVLGDFALASFIDTPANADDVEIKARVTAANTVTVILTNTGAGAAAFGNNSLRATVLKKQT